VSFSHCLASSSKVLADRVGTFRRINGISDHHHSTEKYPLYIDQLPPSNIYISFSSMNSTSCPRAAITSFSDSRLIGLTFSNEWIWSYRLLNWVNLNPNRRWATPLPRVGGLQWRWHWSCSNKALKVVNWSVIYGCDTHFIKPLIFSMCSHFKLYQ